MLRDLVQADGVAVLTFQFAENNGGEHGQSTTTRNTWWMA